MRKEDHHLESFEGTTIPRPVVKEMSNVFIRKNELSYRNESTEYERQQEVRICTDWSVGTLTCSGIWLGLIASLAVVVVVLNGCGDERCGDVTGLVIEQDSKESQGAKEQEDDHDQ